MARGKGQARAMASLAASPQLVSHLIPTFPAEGLCSEELGGWWGGNSQSTQGTALAPVLSHSQALTKCPSCASYSTSPWGDGLTWLLSLQSARGTSRVSELSVPPLWGR